MIASGNKTFYKAEGGQKKYYDIPSKTYKSISGRESFIILENKSENIVWKNADSKIIDLGDGVVVEAAPQAAELGATLFEGLRALKEVIGAGNRPPSSPLREDQIRALSSAAAILNKAGDGLSLAQGRNGATWKQVETEGTRLENRLNLITNLKSERVDANLAELAMRLSEMQVQYQAAAQTFSQLRDMSLLNYLR
jgi:flagellin-like hook-associated protein FlgL